MVNSQLGAAQLAGYDQPYIQQARVEYFFC